MGVDGRDERHEPRERDGAGGSAGSDGRGPQGRTGGGPAQDRHSVPPQRAYGAGAPPTDSGGGELPLSDAQLIAALRAGDDTAYEEMYRRHADAVRRYARRCCWDGHTAEDLTGEVFARTLQAVRGGAGPDTAVRAYLLTTVRRVAASWARTARREQLVEDFAVFALNAAGAARDDDTLELGAEVRAMHEAEQSMAVQAFRSLPERYQTVLWHTTVEDESPSQVAPLLGLTANATAVLAHRAREGLKQAYLQAHVSQALTAGGDCARYADRLGAYARGGLRMRAERGLRKHLDGCARCRTAALEVEDVNQRIGALLPVAVIGWLAAGYAVKTAAAVAGAAGAAAGAAAAAGSGGAGASGGSGGALVGEGLAAPVKVGLGVGAAVAAGAALALALTGSPGPAPKPQARPAQSAPPALRSPSRGPAKPLPPASGAAPAPKPTHTPRPTPTPTPAPPEPAPRPKPKPTPSPARPTPTPTPTPRPPEPSPRPPRPAPTTYRVDALDHDVTGDGSAPEVRTAGSSWLWQRQSPEIAGTTYAHGVSVHAPSSVLIDLNRACTAYDAQAGVDDLTLGLGTLRFSVYADGQRLWRSGVLHGGERAAPVHVPLAGRTTLRLVVEPVSPVDVVAVGDWAQARISCR
ncbi:sigma-70 family RNA polymerase sigma factor [Streptomyces lydicus]|uniref:sigma-70 family RNA polymerase sigma factor n=1 Tax=Streptomyces lydicus TaxID=47763 RepID=UPI000980AD54|nr:sigma-70 family RNA polymerase sigma factor [Streptomyces lydicus]